MHLLSLFLNKRSDERQLQELYRSSEQGIALPEVSSEAREQFEADQHVIDQISELASSTGPADASLQRNALLSRVAEERQGRRAEEGIPMLRRLTNKRAIVAAGAALILVGAAATVGAAGGVSEVAGGVDDVVAALQITDRSNKIDLCHVPADDPNNAHTISVGEDALEEHLAHGDSEGACAENGSPGRPTSLGRLPASKCVTPHRTTRTTPAPSP